MDQVVDRRSADIHPDLSLNELYLKDYLTAPGLIPSIVPDETPYSGVFKIKPGCYVAITQNNITEHSYWSPFLLINIQRLLCTINGRRNI
jgi:hypothetical protein